jgi:hypothetical protein
MRMPSEGQASLQFFLQILDTETVCVHALRALRAENKEDSKEPWSAQRSVP